MTLPSSERQNGLNAVKRLFDFVGTNIRVLTEVWAIIGWTTIILAPNFVEGFEFRTLKKEAKFIHRNFMLQEALFQYGTRLHGSGYQRLRVSQLGEFWPESFPQLHSGKPFSVKSGEVDGKSVGAPCPEQGTKGGATNANEGNSIWTYFHFYLALVVGWIIGAAISLPLIWFLCKYVWYA